MSGPRFLTLLSRWRKDASGTAAIEFGILGPVFIAMLCGVMFLGVFMFNCNRVDNTARLAARAAMLLNEPTDAEIEAEVNLVFAQLPIDGVEVEVSTGQRADGGREAIIVASYTIEGVSAYLNTDNFGHEIELRAPLRQ